MAPARPPGGGASGGFQAPARSRGSARAPGVALPPTARGASLEGLSGPRPVAGRATFPFPGAIPSAGPTVGAGAVGTPSGAEGTQGASSTTPGADTSTTAPGPRGAGGRGGGAIGGAGPSSEEGAAPSRAAVRARPIRSEARRVAALVVVAAGAASARGAVVVRVGAAGPPALDAAARSINTHTRKVTRNGRTFEATGCAIA